MKFLDRARDIVSIVFSLSLAFTPLLNAAPVIAAPPVKPVLALSAATTSVSGPATPSVGRTSTYDVVYTLANTGTADALTPSASIPVSGSYIRSSSSTGSLSGSTTVAWTGSAVIAAGGSITITVRVSVTPTAADAGKAMALTGAASAAATDAAAKSYSASASAVSTAAVAANALPSCTATSLTVNEDTAGTLALGCTDADGDPISYSISTQATKGTASVNAQGMLSFTPSTDANGADSVVVGLTDGIGSTTKTISITITPVNDAPRCTATTLSTDEDATGSIAFPCTDPEGSTLSYTFSRPAKGSAAATTPGFWSRNSPRSTAPISWKRPFGTPGGWGSRH